MGKKKGVKKGVKKGLKKGAKKRPARKDAAPKLEATYASTSALREAQDLKLREVDKESTEFQELVSSIKKHGFYDPILVTQRDGGIFVVDGYNRLAAAREVGLKEVPVTHVRGSREDLVLAAFDLSTRRINMTPMTEARAVARAMEALGTKTAKEVAKRMGRSERWVSIHTQLLALPKDLQKGLDGGDVNITVGKCYELLRVHPEDRGRFVGKLRELTEPFFRSYIENAVKNGLARWADGRKEPRKKAAAKKSPAQQADKHKRTPQTAMEEARGPEVVVSSEPVIEARSVAELQRGVRKAEASLAKWEERRKAAETKGKEKGKGKGLKGKKLQELVDDALAKFDAKHYGNIVFIRGQIAFGLFALNLNPDADSLEVAIKEWRREQGLDKPKPKKVGKKKATKKKAPKKTKGKKKAAKKKGAKKKSKKR